MSASCHGRGGLQARTWNSELRIQMQAAASPFCQGLRDVLTSAIRIGRSTHALRTCRRRPRAATKVAFQQRLVARARSIAGTTPRGAAVR